MPKPNEFKIAADIIRRVLDAAERGEIDYLTQLKQASRRKASDGKQTHAKQEAMEFGRFGAKFTTEDILEEIEKFTTVQALAEHLRTKYVTRSDIDSVARAIQVPSPKTLDYESVIERVVDATLGYKMRSKAIRGEGPDRKTR